MKQDHVTLRLAGNWLDDVRAHVAAAGGSDDGLRTVRVKSDEKYGSREENAAEQSECEFASPDQDSVVISEFEAKERNNKRASSNAPGSPM